MIDLVAGHSIAKWQTYRRPRRHSKCRPTHCVGQQKSLEPVLVSIYLRLLMVIIIIIITIIIKLLWRRKVVTSEALGSISQLCVLVKR